MPTPSLAGRESPQIQEAACGHTLTGGRGRAPAPVNRAQTSTPTPGTANTSARPPDVPGNTRQGILGIRPDPGRDWPWVRLTGRDHPFDADPTKLATGRRCR